MRIFRFLLLLPLFMAGCAHQGVSKESLMLADRTVTYPVLRENPDEFAGKYVHLGGAIAGVRNMASGSEIEVVELPLNRSGKPESGSASGGRFLARGDQFLDPLVFKPGLYISLVGKVKGQKVGLLDNVEYHYPLILIQELHLWKPENFVNTSPRFHFGLGLFKGF